MMAAPDHSILMLEDWPDGHHHNDPDWFITMESIHSLDNGGISNETTIKAEIPSCDTERVVSDSDVSFTNLIDQAEYDDYLAIFFLGEYEIVDDLSPL
jgi:hypothetical protein